LSPFLDRIREGGPSFRPSAPKTTRRLAWKIFVPSEHGVTGVIGKADVSRNSAIWREAVLSGQGFGFARDETIAVHYLA
jgi:hypothetical protein